eukprot:COSAG02_NODE_6785_length_3362_cov_5.357953_2_plen_181_part_00
MLMGRLSACSRAPVARHCAGLGGKRAAAGSAAAAVHRRRGFAEMPTPPPGYRAKLACLDLEGVLIPEVWVNLAERVGVEELKRTTRDEPVYEKLMRYRLDIMKREGLTIHDINAAIDAMEPFPGAPEFVEVRAPARPMPLRSRPLRFASGLRAQGTPLRALRWPGGPPRAAPVICRHARS